MSYRARNNVLHHRYALRLDMVGYGLHMVCVKRKENIYIRGNVTALQIILRNKILGNNNLFKVTST